MKFIIKARRIKEQLAHKWNYKLQPFEKLFENFENQKKEEKNEN